ncbi:unnamed protein product [Phaedon cochleariae]|uniref:Flap endonuclease GEN n=1 Tax=Phaedon cochleariae TaxID=80249 RepID=A0A9P0GQ51_PHACE|nr:unnamed protein product [Phaedon cochleariae]
MGIKNLWTLLTPFCERKPLYELYGKTVAIDLSCWICEAQNIAEYQVQPRMYLRNLYFRACYLLLIQVNPVFILEGKAPELKYDTIAARNAVQFKGAKPKSDNIRTGKDRTRFNFVLKQCEEMLGHMGLACITGKGEAESLCAYLNDEGLVDGCISQDSDCFAYGAKIVYRNFSIASQGAYTASGGAVDIYDINKACHSMNFGRNKIIAMALLCGCDYNDGVLGVGKESVFKLFEKLSDEETLDRLRSWRKNDEMYEKFENQVSDKNICTSCGHRGKLQAHNRNGCNICGTISGCDPFKFKEERMRIKNELNIRSRALQDPNFPDENLINEFLVKKDNVSKLDLKWRQPDLVAFVHFSAKFLQWEELYAFEKMLPILTRWQCLNYDALENKNIKGKLFPKRIKKVRNPKGIPSYEIVWFDKNEYFKGLVPEDQIQEEQADVEKIWSTIEPQILVDKAYPKLVEDFRLSKIKPKTSKRKKKAGTEELVKNSSISEPVLKKPKKKQDNKKKGNKKALDNLENSFNELQIDLPKKNVATLDNYLRKAVLNSHKQKNAGESLGIPVLTSTPSKSSNGSFDISSFCDENDDLDLSDIVEGIVSRQPNYFQDDLKKFNLKLDTSEHYQECMDANSSSFFITNPVEFDLFEKTFDHEDESGESTDEYEFDENEFRNMCETEAQELVDDYNENEIGSAEDKIISEHVEGVLAEDDDSFCVKYVPLLERLKKFK